MKNQSYLERGFTLIELLVAIAIIGLLAAIVLAFMGTARGKANDAAVKGMIQNTRAAAEQYFVSNNSAYGTSSGTAGSCGNGSPNGSAMWNDATTNMRNLVSSIQTAVGATNMDCGTSAASWSIAVRLPGGTYWCIDNTGKVKSTQGSGSTAYAGLNTAGATNAHNGAGATVCN